MDCPPLLPFSDINIGRDALGVRARQGPYLGAVLGVMLMIDGSMSRD